VTSGTEATAATVKAMAEAGVAARAATANGMVEIAAAATSREGELCMTPAGGGQRKRLSPERLWRTCVVEVAATAQQGAVAPGAQIDWQAIAETVVEGSEDWQVGNAGVEAAAAVAGGAAKYGPGAAAAETAGTAAGVRPPRPANWGTRTREQRRNWNQQGGRPRKSPGHGGPC